MYNIIRSFSKLYNSKIGFLFDIDGVITQGQGKLIPKTHEAFELLNQNSIPYMFLTNSDDSEKHKASELSKMLEPHKIRPEQVITAHSPLRLIPDEIRTKRFLAVGQGPYLEVAKQMGFNKLSSVEEVLISFPEISTVCWAKREAISKLKKTSKLSNDFERIEGVLLMGSPVNWETSLQVIFDTIQGNGVPFSGPSRSPRIPVIVCNQDLVWKSFAPDSRMGHGSFIACLKHIYSLVTSQKLRIDHKLGKPFPITYRYAIDSFSKEFGNVDRLYCVGDNVDADIIGANRYKSQCQRIQSVLVRTGVYDPRVRILSKDEEKPDFVAENVFNFIRDLLK